MEVCNTSGVDTVLLPHPYHCARAKVLSVETTTHMQNIVIIHIHVHFALIDIRISLIILTSNMGQIDQQQHTKQVEKTSSTDVTMRDSFSSLSSSILSTLGLGFGTYGICDSLTMTKQKQTVRLCGDDEDIENTVTMDDYEDEIDAAWREFDCSWEDVNVKKKNENDMPKLSVSPSRRSGVRRGHHDGTTTGTSIKMISVPTKCIDGPSPKQSIPRAA